LSWIGHFKLILILVENLASGFFNAKIRKAKRKKKKIFFQFLQRTLPLIAFLGS